MMAGQEIKTQKAKTFAVFGVGLAAMIAGWVLPLEGDGLASFAPVVLLVIGFICMVIAAKMARKWNTEAAVKQAEQTGRKARIYALIGCGIAAFVIAGQYAIAGASSLAMPVAMGGIGLACFIVAGITALSVIKESAAK